MTDPVVVGPPIKPCPFCSEYPRITVDDTYGNCMVFCTCDAEPCIVGEVGQVIHAIDRWNKRTPLAVVVVSGDTLNLNALGCSHGCRAGVPCPHCMGISVDLGKINDFDYSDLPDDSPDCEPGKHVGACRHAKPETAKPLEQAIDETIGATPAGDWGGHDPGARS